MHTPVQVTVVEYVSEFFRKYKSRAYGKSISLNAKGGADALMGEHSCSRQQWQQDHVSGFDISMHSSASAA
jgi:hypothetical protein